MVRIRSNGDRRHERWREPDHGLEYTALLFSLTENERGPASREQGRSLFPVNGDSLSLRRSQILQHDAIVEEIRVLRVVVVVDPIHGERTTLVLKRLSFSIRSSSP